MLLNKKEIAKKARKNIADIAKARKAGIDIDLVFKSEAMKAMEKCLKAGFKSLTEDEKEWIETYGLLAVFNFSFEKTNSGVYRLTLGSQPKQRLLLASLFTEITEGAAAGRSEAKQKP